MSATIPRLFIGSSSDALPAAQALAAALRPRIHAIVWPAIFAPADFTLEALAREVERADFGLLLFSPADTLRIRKQTRQAVRDNVVFEFGLFVGRLGRRAAFYLVPEPAGDLRIPSDLAGLTAFTYDPSTFASDADAAMKPVAVRVRRTVRDILNGAGTTKTYTGTWKQTWHFQGSSNFGARNASIASALHVDRRFRASFESKGVAYVVDAEVEGRLITGIWRDASRGGVYFGSFQLAIMKNGTRLEGRWIGHRENLSEVATGTWVWERSS